MFSRILVLTDFSNAARAAEASVRSNFPAACVRVLHVGLRRADTSDDVIVSPGDPASVALEQAGSGAYDLLVVGTSGKNALQRFLLGSVAERVVRESPVAVLTVHADHDPSRLFRRPLVATDFSAAAKRATELARQLPQAEVHLLHVVESGTLDTPLAFPAARRGASAAALGERDRLWAAEARERLDRLGGGTVAQGEPASQILEHAAQHDLIVMGTAGRRGLEGLLFGSVAQRVVREATVPVLTVRT
ncbi:universal stress protein [Deinococcus peraridilitoris]|uniref:Universal stress protein UspA-like protein n=1 Tax=Deinococcus peraridilitoris (strain DSM 19664 / LMG 22246 / CIP 109416 / KR-200) TaxID=937777 RepID=L0A0H4_DEIPD|nr:universal stress protein [Deinococcus peraridilitoris]AFZ66652.1 universal stress protein UspA-like protein [Deinococcus peraridilitoris DSM 19664]